MRLQRLIEELLYIVKIEKGTYQLQIESVRLKEIVRYSAEGMQEMALKSNVKLEVVIEDSVVVSADRKALRHILYNLISNAIRFNKSSD